MENEELSGNEKILEVVIDRFERGYSSKLPLGEAIPSGFRHIDEICAGFVPGELVILGGLPAVGKTSLAFNICSNVVFESQKNVFIISSEAKQDRLMERFLSSGAQIPIKKFRTAKFDTDDWSKLTEMVSLYAKADNLRFGETKNMELSEIVQLVKKENEKRKIDFLLVDGVQSIKVPEAETKATELSEVVRTLKSIAVNEELLVFGCSHLNRNLFQRSDRRPILTDLLGAGSIEHEADIVFFLYCEQDQPTKDKVVEVLISKNRGGAKGVSKLTFTPEYLRFLEYLF